jgi:hypothetical protein
MSDEQINKKLTIKKLEDELSNERTEWNKIIGNLANRIKEEIRFAMQLESESLSRRQELTEVIGLYSFKINKLMPGLKNMKKKLFEHYALKYQIKTNGSEKNKLIDADMAYAEAQVQAYENHIEFLIESRKSVDHIIWSIKNKIKLYEITEMIG